MAGEGIAPINGFLTMELYYLQGNGPFLKAVQYPVCTDESGIYLRFGTAEVISTML